MRSICSGYFLVLFLIINPNENFGQPENPETLAGHSYHGEVFNEGPRQQARLMDGLGRCQFKVSATSERAQAFFNQGIDQLHGFWYFEAERSFRQVAMLDGNCAMAYWGLSMANINNKQRAEKFIEEAKQRLENDEIETTEREQKYILALHDFYFKNKKQSKTKKAAELTKKLEEIVLKFPDDIEAKAFLACQVWMNQRDIKIASYVGMNAILDEIFEQSPDHPAHHYRIHLWDYENPEVALRSAALCGPSLPRIAHMWHMPGHIYSRLKRYEDAVWQQEASARVDHKNMMNDWVLPDQIHNFAHNNEWCIRNLIHIGRIDDAIDLARNMISLPRHPKYNSLKKRGSSRYGRQRLFQVLSTFEMWDSLIHACEHGILEESGVMSEDLKRLRFLGRAYYRSGNHEAHRKTRAKLQSKLELLTDEKNKSELKAKTDEQELTDRFVRISASLFDRFPTFNNEPFQHNFKNLIRRENRIRVNKSIKNSTKEIEEQINIAERAIDELEAYSLLNENEYDKAYEKLEKAGQVDPIYRAHIKHLAGKTDEALKEAREHVESKKNEVQPRAMLTWLLWETGNYQEAADSLLELQKISSSAKIEALFFQKLAPVLDFAELKSNWKSDSNSPDDIGERPALDSLGPFRWQPIAAPSWSLMDSNDQTISLSQYSGQPIILIFYLGHGCLHCAEQLQAFAPKTGDFLDAGIEMVAISTDERQGLKKSIMNYGSVPLPIQLLADSKLDVFKQYHAYDEFEEQPLHATFLIDGDGFIRWQDISYEPFMDAEFLLNESKRLLVQPVVRAP
ncbi:MAG: redoxin domain-containing protein [Planctomycetota bacterium]